MTYASPSCTKVLGYEPEVLLGRGTRHYGPRGRPRGPARHPGRADRRTSRGIGRVLDPGPPRRTDRGAGSRGSRRTCSTTRRSTGMVINARDVTERRHATGAAGGPLRSGPRGAAGDDPRGVGRVGCRGDHRVVRGTRLPDRRRLRQHGQRPSIPVTGSADAKAADDRSSADGTPSLRVFRSVIPSSRSHTSRSTGTVPRPPTTSSSSRACRGHRVVRRPCASAPRTPSATRPCTIHSPDCRTGPCSTTGSSTPCADRPASRAMSR